MSRHRDNLRGNSRLPGKTEGGAAGRDEVGLDGFSDPYCRKTYPYGKEDFELLSYFKELSNVRKKNKKDLTSDFNLFYKEKGFYSFKRGNLLCGINLSDNTVTINCEKENIEFFFGKIEKKENGYNIYPNSLFILS